MFSILNCLQTTTLVARLSNFRISSSQKEGQALRKYDNPEYPCVELQRDGHILSLTS